MHVLVIDDDAAVRLLVSGTLELDGHAVTAVATVAEGLAAAANMPDVILLDGVLGAESGLWTLEQLKRQPDTAAIPVILFSANDRRQDIDRAIAAGAAGYIGKPFNPDTLAARIQKILAAGQTPSGGGSVVDMATLVPDVEARAKRFQSATGELDAELRAAFVEQAERYVSDAENAAEGWRPKDLAKSAHSLKGIGGMMGAPRISVVADDLDAAAKAGDRARCAALVEALVRWRAGGFGPA
jgi:two-component system, OmpR family, phosphate regulon response regulator PhoB